MHWGSIVFWKTVSVPQNTLKTLHTAVLHLLYSNIKGGCWALVGCYNRSQCRKGWKKNWFTETMVSICLCVCFVKKYWKMIRWNQVFSLNIWRAHPELKDKEWFCVLVIIDNYIHKRNFVVKCEGDSLVWNQYAVLRNLKRKLRGDMAYYITTVWKSGGTRPPCPPPNCVHNHTALTLK